MSKILGIFPKANEIGIFVYAGALFFFVVYVAIYQINIDPSLVGVFGFILVLLLYRYFHEIKFGGLSLRKDMTDNDNKFEAFKSSSLTYAATLTSLSVPMYSIRPPRMYVVVHTMSRPGNLEFSNHLQT